MRNNAGCVLFSSPSSHRCLVPNLFQVEILRALVFGDARTLLGLMACENIMVVGELRVFDGF